VHVSVQHVQNAMSPCRWQDWQLFSCAAWCTQHGVQAAAQPSIIVSAKLHRLHAAQQHLTQPCVCGALSLPCWNADPDTKHHAALGLHAAEAKHVGSAMFARKPRLQLFRASTTHVCLPCVQGLVETEFKATYGDEQVASVNPVFNQASLEPLVDAYNSTKQQLEDLCDNYTSRINRRKPIKPKQVGGREWGGWPVPGESLATCRAGTGGTMTGRHSATCMGLHEKQGQHWGCAFGQVEPCWVPAYAQVVLSVGSGGAGRRASTRAVSLLA
jgi:hypothetical protein